MTEPLLKAEGLIKSFTTKRSLFGKALEQVHAVRDVDLEVHKGKTLGLVGESGSGKSTLARLVQRQLDVDTGTVTFDGQDVTRIEGAALKQYRRDVSFVFQDPYASLNPSWTVRRIVGEPLVIHGLASGAALREAVTQRLADVGLDASALDRYPAQFSGGQRQRIAIARALTTQPRVLVCDEPVSALDVSTRAQVLTILNDLQRDLGLAILLISHDLPVVRAMSERIAVMYLGEIVESGPSESIMTRPLHPYTVALLAASPDVHAPLDRKRVVLRAETPSPTKIFAGCAFAGRCPLTMDRCHTERPPTVSFGDQVVRCHLHAQGARQPGSTPDLLEAIAA
jgi:oligopeptide/dipeptide ABC transporter ATP-binding protein